MSRRKRFLFLLVLCGYGVITIDGSIVITGLTHIATDLSLSQVLLSWVQTAYVLAFGGFILLSGKLSDVFGRKRIINLALLLFGASSAVAGAAPNGFVMIGTRIFQGISAAMLAPTSLALLMDTFAGKERIKAISWYSSISGLGSSFGLFLGGFLASTVSWRVGFYLNVPITLGMLMISLKYVDYTPLHVRSFDIHGTVLSVAGIFSFIYAINGSSHPLPWIIVSLCLLLAFIYTEKRTPLAIMPLSLFTSRIRTGAYIIRFLFMCAMMSFWFFLSEYLQHIQQFSPLQTGLAFFPMTLSLFGMALMVPRFIQHYGNIQILRISIVFLALSFLGALFVTPQTSYTELLIPVLLLSGIGQGLALTPMTNLGIKNAAPEISGAASGLVNVTHFLGGSFGLAVMVAAGEYTPLMMEKFHVAMELGLFFIVSMGFCVFCFYRKNLQNS